MSLDIAEIWHPRLETYCCSISIEFHEMFKVLVEMYLAMIELTVSVESFVG